MTTTDRSTIREKGTMSSKITIPTAEELTDRLGGLDRLLTAKRWERAAIVYAFTTNEGVGRPENGPDTGHFPVPAREFARLGFAGLRKHDTVARYRNAWQRAVDEGHAQPTEPGQEITLPELDWPPYYDSTAGDDRYEAIPRGAALRAQAEEDGVGASKVLDVAKNRAAIAVAIKADPKVAETAREALAATPGGRPEHVSSDDVVRAVQADPEIASRVLDQATPEQLASAVDNRADAREALARRPLADQRVGASFRKVRDEYRAEHPAPERAPVDIDVYAERVARRVDNLFIPERHILTQQLDELIQYRDHLSPAAQMKLARAFSALAARVEGYRDQLRTESPQTVTPDRDPDFALLELEGVEEKVVES